MYTYRSLCRRLVLKPFGLCSVLLCLTPFLLDVATCDELYAAPLRQAALIDGEEVDPSKATTTLTSYDHHTSECLLQVGYDVDSKGVSALDKLVPMCDVPDSYLTFRSPPVS